MSSRGGGRNTIKDAQVPDGRRLGSYPEVGFEEIGALTMVNSITLPRSRLLDSGGEAALF